MGELNLNAHKIADEIVGVVGMLNNRGGSTLKDIKGVLESLHGPMRQDIIQAGLEAGILSGSIECKNRRYKVHKQKVVFMNRSTGSPVPGCSSWEYGDTQRLPRVPRDTDLIEDVASISSVSTQFDQDMVDEISCPFSESSVKEILSVKSLQSSDDSICTYPYSFRSEESLNGSDLKGRKRKAKKRLVVKLPMFMKNSAVENDSGNTPIVIDDSDQQIKDVDISKSGQVLDEDRKTQECLQNDLLYDSLKKSSDSPLPAKRSMKDIMVEVMKQFSVQNECDYGKNEKIVSCNKVIENEEEAGTLDLCKIMTRVMENVNTSEKTGSTPEILSKDGEYGGVVPESLSSIITNVMKKITGREEQQHGVNVSSVRSGESPSYADESTSKSTSRSVATDPPDALPSTSKNKSSKPAKKEKKLKQEYDNSDTANKYRYMTRSRAKAGELKRSRPQSSSGSDTSLKRGKFSED